MELTAPIIAELGGLLLAAIDPEELGRGLG